MTIIDTENIEKAKKLIKTEKRPIIVKAQDDNFNRKMLEYGKFDILLSVESGNRKDTIRQLDSGLNHVLAEIAAKNNVAIGIDFNDIKGLDKKEKAAELAKIKQNIKICRKAKVKMKAINALDKRDALAFFLSLGASTQQTKDIL